MSLRSPLAWAPAALVACMLAAPAAHAATQLVTFNVLNASVTLPTPLLSGDVLRMDTFVSGQTGALLQTINFTVGGGVGSLSGEAAWEISTAAGPGPRLTGVNIDIFNNATNTLVTSDTLAGTLGGFAVSTFSSAIGPGSYRLVATGTGVRESSLDVSLIFAPVPEPEVYAMLLAGLGVVGLLARRRA